MFDVIETDKEDLFEKLDIERNALNPLCLLLFYSLGLFIKCVALGYSPLSMPIGQRAPCFDLIVEFSGLFKCLKRF